MDIWWLNVINALQNDNKLAAFLEVNSTPHCTLCGKDMTFFKFW